MPALPSPTIVAMGGGGFFASRPAARDYRVVRGPTGAAIETELPTRYLA